MRGEQADPRYPRWLRATVGTAGDIVLFAALSLLVWTVLPAVALGATPVIISGGSMSPLIRAGDVVLLDDTTPPDGEMFAPGTVITYEATDRAGASTGHLVTHRVAGVADGRYVTRGDANASDDARTVHPDQLVGAGRWLVPVIGLPVHWARSGASHLVIATVLAGAAAVAASLLGRRRLVIELPEEREGDQPVEQPERPAVPAPAVAEPAVPEPVLAFSLPTADDEPDPALDDEHALDPAAAERAATIAARAARRGGAGLDRVREDDRDQETVGRPSGAGDTAGSAPVASIIAIAVALLGTTLVPSYAAAAFVATTSNAGNSFSTAPAAPGGDVDVDIDITTEWATGYCANVTVSTTSTTPIAWEVQLDLTTTPLHGTPYTIWNATTSLDAGILTASGAGHGWNDTVVAGSPAPWGYCANRPAPTSLELPAYAGDTVLNPGNNTRYTYSWAFPVTQTTPIYGDLVANLWVRSANPPGGAGVDRDLTVDVLVDGDLVATSGQVSVPHSWTFQQRSIPLAPAAERTVPAGSTIEVRVEVYRNDLEVGSGRSSITLPTGG